MLSFAPSSLLLGVTTFLSVRIAARELGLVGLFQDDSELSEADEVLGKSPSHWALLAKRPAELVPFEGDARWTPLAEDPELGVWSDDFSNIFRSFVF